MNHLISASDEDREYGVFRFDMTHWLSLLQIGPHHIQKVEVQEQYHFFPQA